MPSVYHGGRRNPRRELLLARTFLEDFLSGVIAGKAGDSAAGMGTGTAEIKIFYRRVVARPTRDRTHEENLVESHFSVIDMASREPVFRFQIQWREDLAV